MMHSNAGCTLKITGTSTKVRGLTEPEKVKEFNKALTKTEIAQGENNTRRKELYVQELEEKYNGKSLSNLKLQTEVEQRSLSN